MQQVVDGFKNGDVKKDVSSKFNMTNATKTNETSKAANVEKTETKKKNGLAGKIVSVILWLIVGLLCIALVSTIVSEGENSILGFRSFYVKTDSMTPTFSAGSWILVKETPISNIEVGDIVTFHLKDKWETMVTHRCINIDQDENGAIQVWTQGDANTGADANPVIDERLVGETVFWINGLGSVLTMFQSVPGFIFLGILIFLMIFIPEFIHYIRKKEN